MNTARLEEPFVQWDDLWDKGDQWQGAQSFQTTSETFPMQQRDELQVFTFKEPILCVGGLFKVRCGAQVARGPAQYCLMATFSQPACRAVTCLHRSRMLPLQMH